MRHDLSLQLRNDIRLLVLKPDHFLECLVHLVLLVEDVCVEDRWPRFALRLVRSFLLLQELRNVSSVVRFSNVLRSLADVVPELDVCSGVQKKNNNVAPVVQARIVKWSVATFVLYVNVRFLLNKKFGGVLVAKPAGAVKSRLPGEVDLIDVDLGA